MSRARFLIASGAALAALALGAGLWDYRPSRLKQPTSRPAVRAATAGKAAASELARSPAPDQTPAEAVGGGVRPRVPAGEHGQAMPGFHTGPDLEAGLVCLDAATRAPLAGVLVEIEGLDAADDFIAGATERAESDARGAVALRLFSRCRYSARISRPGYVPGTMELAWKPAPAAPELEVLLAPRARLLGQIWSADGAPRDNLQVELEVAHRAPDAPVVDRVLGERFWNSGRLADGRYAFDDLPAGVDLDLLVTNGGHRMIYEPGGVRLAPGEVLVRDFHLEAEVTLRGVLLDAAGEPTRGTVWVLAGSTPRLLDPNERYLWYSHADHQGRFWFESLQPGSWLVGPSPEHPDEPLVALGQVVVLRPGVRELEIEVRSPAPVYVRGRCVGPDGEPVADVCLLASVSVGAAGAKSGSDGAFHFPPLPAGPLELAVAEAPAGYAAAAPFSIQAGDEDVTVRLERAQGFR